MNQDLLKQELEALANAFDAAVEKVGHQVVAFSLLSWREPSPAELNTMDCKGGD